GAPLYGGAASLSENAGARLCVRHAHRRLSLSVRARCSSAVARCGWSGGRSHAAACIPTGGAARRGDDRRCRMSTFERTSSAPPELDDIGVNLPAPADFSTALAEGFARRIGTLARRGG